MDKKQEKRLKKLQVGNIECKFYDPKIFCDEILRKLNGFLSVKGCNLCGIIFKISLEYTLL